MKRPLLLLALQCSSAALVAQPTLTSDWNPGTGHQFKYYKLGSGAGISEGTAGANTTWDFSANTALSSTNSYLVSPAIVEGNSNYPTASYADTSFSAGITTSNFMKESDDSLFFLGYRAQVLTTDIFLVYNNPEKIITYPFTFNSTFSDAYVGEGMNVPYTVFTGGTVIATADAWGTLTTPIGTFQNTLRVKREMTSYININFNQAPNPPAASNDTAVSYTWYSAEFPGVALFSLTNGSADGVAYSEAFYVEPEFVGLSKVNGETSFSVFPNPASSSFSVSVSKNKDVQSAGIYSLEGKLLRSVSSELAGGSRNAVSTAGIAPGMYIVRIDTQDGSSSAKLVIQ